MKAHHCAVLLLILGAPAKAEVPAGYMLVWSDEFDQDGPPDPTKWVADTHANKSGWYNREEQYHSAGKLQNATVRNGRLVITALREALTSEPDYGGQRYTSARLITKGLAAWTYGYFEVRAKLPCGAGTWPAIWTLGATRGHPDGGEIDIMEHVGNDPRVVHATIHNRATVGTHGDGGSLKLPTACTNFHDYQLTWTPQALAVAVDGKPIHLYAKAGKSTAGWPFDAPQYLLLNLAIGGQMGGHVDDTIFPVAFEIDHVRVYQRR